MQRTLSKPGWCRAIPRQIGLLLCAALVVGWWLSPCVHADDVDDALVAIAAAGPNGAGSAAARKAATELQHGGPELLPRLLVAMDTTNVVAANWLRTIYDDIVTRELKKEKPQFPLDLLKDVVRNPKRQGRLRRLALEIVDREDPAFRGQLIPTLLDDPEFRAEAVGRVLSAGDAAVAAKENTAAREAFERAFRHARQPDQVQAAAGKLKALGQDVNVSDHLGFFVDWLLIGPFDAPGTSGFTAVFPPEKEFNPAAEYSGQSGKVAWKPYHTPDVLGQVNLSTALVTTTEAVGYAYAEFDAPQAIDTQLRCGADDNCSVWLNGEKVFARLQWLNGTRTDRFITPVKIPAGKNRLLVKICQGPQHVDPAVPNNWSFQLRFCDATGGGVGLVHVFPKPEK